MTHCHVTHVCSWVARLWKCLNKNINKKQKRKSPNSIAFWSVTFTADFMCVWFPPTPLPPPPSPPSSYKHADIRQDAYQFVFKISFQLKSVACCRLSKSIYALENFRALMRWWKDHASIWTPRVIIEMQHLSHPLQSFEPVDLYCWAAFWGPCNDVWTRLCRVFSPWWCWRPVSLKFDPRGNFQLTLRVHLPVESTSSSGLYLLFLVFCLFFVCLLVFDTEYDNDNLKEPSSCRSISCNWNGWSTIVPCFIV